MYENIELNKYPACGKWLLDLTEYKDWNTGRTDVLWVHGTGN
jgi:hypothetical protein